MRLRTKALIVGLIMGIMLNLAIIFSAIFYGPGGLPFEKFTGRGMGGNVELCIDWYINLSEVLPQSVKYDTIYRIDLNLTEKESIYYPLLNFTDNTSLFDINATTGEINFTANSSQRGQYVANITIGNNACREPDDSMIFIINVTDQNFAPLINMTYNISMYEDLLFYFNISNFSSDPDGNALSFYDNTPLFVIGENTGIIEFTPDDADIGNYTVRLSVIDPGLLIDFQDVLFSIISVNDVPNLSAIGAKTVQVGLSLNFTLRAYDQDSADTLAFSSNTSWFLNSTGPINTSSNWAEYPVTIYMPNESWINDTFSINVTVNDSYGAQDSEIISVTFIRYNHAPNITSYNPVEKAFTIYSDQCQLFNISKEDLDGTTPSTRWYVDDNETGTTTDDYSFCPSNVASYNVTVVITDGIANDSESWIVAVTTRPPVLQPSTTRGGAGGGGAGKFCEPRWICSDWQSCQPGNIQARSCPDRNRCGKLDNKPLETQACIYTEFPTCFDGIKNQDELLADCGGVCKDCPTCDDGIQNQGEQGIDCSGPCPVCKELLAPAKVEKIPVELNQIVSNISVYWVFWLLVSVLFLSMIRAVREISIERIIAARRKGPVPKINRLLKLSYKEIQAKNHDKAKQYYDEAKALYDGLSDGDKKRIDMKGIS